MGYLEQFIVNSNELIACLNPSVSLNVVVSGVLADLPVRNMGLASSRPRDDIGLIGRK